MTSPTATSTRLSCKRTRARFLFHPIVASPQTGLPAQHQLLIGIVASRHFLWIVAPAWCHFLLIVLNVCHHFLFLVVFLFLFFLRSACVGACRSSSRSSIFPTFPPSAVSVRATPPTSPAGTPRSPTLSGRPATDESYASTFFFFFTGPKISYFFLFHIFYDFINYSMIPWLMIDVLPSNKIWNVFTCEGSQLPLFLFKYFSWFFFFQFNDSKNYISWIIQHHLFKNVQIFFG